MIAAGSCGLHKCVTSLSFSNVSVTRIEVLEQNTVLRRRSVWYNQKWRLDYGMDDLYFESREGQKFFLFFSLAQIIQTGFGDHTTFCSFCTGILHRVKAAWALC